MRNSSIIFSGKVLSFISKSFNLGNGSTWPGEIALSINRHIINDIFAKSKTKVILIAGTNGKTTTSKMLAGILQGSGKTVMLNTSGANLLNGIASTLIRHVSFSGTLHVDYAIFEIDENSLSLLLEEVKPDAIILLNLFRDQLDRYGELDSIAKKWKKSFERLTKDTFLILNSDDPLIASLGEKSGAAVVYYGLSEKDLRERQLQHASDSIYCPYCQHKLTYSSISYSHLGNWDCSYCKHTRPNPTVTNAAYPLPGVYNKYNALAASAYPVSIGIPQKIINNALLTIKPAFGRQEEITVGNKKVKIFLSKNPASFNQSLETIKTLKAKTVFFILNDRIPDGRDISWIWDIDIEEYLDQFDKIYVSGDRLYDMALRLQYASNIQSLNGKIKTYENLNDGITTAIKTLSENETLYILPTYSAMLEARKVLTGKKIL